jgi:hypothetical protein
MFAQSRQITNRLTDLAASRALEPAPIEFLVPYAPRTNVTFYPTFESCDERPMASLTIELHGRPEHLLWLILGTVYASDISDQSQNVAVVSLIG